ncbi:hypothetical protein DFH06DRAFT_1137033 [Mycena polygramma]|nr:hypothetical protein DFH06DRAFT_1137033 [Mycena polygramma]
MPERLRQEKFEYFALQNVWTMRPVYMNRGLSWDDRYPLEKIVSAALRHGLITSCSTVFKGEPPLSWWIAWRSTHSDAHPAQALLRPDRYPSLSPLSLSSSPSMSVSALSRLGETVFGNPSRDFTLVDNPDAPDIAKSWILVPQSMGGGAGLLAIRGSIRWAFQRSRGNPYFLHTICDWVTGQTG